MSQESVSLSNLFKFWKSLPHQQDAVALLEEDLKKNGPEVALKRNRAWHRVWTSNYKLQVYNQALEFICKFESLELKAYPDPDTKAEPWTIGYGITRYPDGSSVRKGDTLTGEKAALYFRFEVYETLHSLGKTIPYWNEMSANQQGALLSFAFNSGKNFFGSTGYNTISKRLRDKDWGKVPEALLLYVNPGSTVEEGLTRRRKAEGLMWQGKTEGS